MHVQREPRQAAGSLVMQLKEISASNVPLRRDRMRVVIKYGRSAVGKWNAHEVGLLNEEFFLMKLPLTDRSK